MRIPKSKEMSRLLYDLRSNHLIATSFAFGDTHHITLKSDSTDQLNPADLERFLLEKGHEDISIMEIEASIEDCFMELSQEE